MYLYFLLLVYTGAVAAEDCADAGLSKEIQIRMYLPARYSCMYIRHTLCTRNNTHIDGRKPKLFSLSNVYFYKKRITVGNMANIVQYIQWKV